MHRYPKLRANFESKPDLEKQIYLDIYEALHAMTPEAREVLLGVVQGYAKMYPVRERPLLRLVG